MSIKKNLSIFFVLILFSIVSQGQIIITVAGNGVSGDTGDGDSATHASITYPGYLSIDDSGYLYIGENSNYVRKISVSGIITTIAGNGSSVYSGDSGLAILAGLSQPIKAIKDRVGNIYVADDYDNRVRKIDTNGVITTIAGNGIGGYTGDGGLAVSAELYAPSGLCFDSSWNLYIADNQNRRVRKIDASGIITTVAGNGEGGSAIDSGYSLDIGIGGPNGIYIDRNNALYIADGYSKILKMSLTTGIIERIAGTNIAGFSGDGGKAKLANLAGPLDVCVDNDGNMYISDNENYRIRKVDPTGIITTVTGTGVGAYNGDGGLADTSNIFSPRGVAIDGCGNLYIADNGNNRIRKVIFNPSCLPEAVPSIQSLAPTSIYPNPAQNEITITSNNIQRVTISNMVGQTVFAQAYHTQKAQINIANLPQGLYFVKVNDGYVQKILKE